MKKVNIVEVRFTHGASAQFHADAWHYDNESENWEITEGGKPAAGIPRSHVLYVTNLGEVESPGWEDSSDTIAAWFEALTPEQRAAISEVVTAWQSTPMLAETEPEREPELPILDVREAVVYAKRGDGDDVERLT